MKTTLSTICRTAALLLTLYLLPSCTKEARAGRKLDSAIEHMKHSDFAAAEIEYKNVLDLQPGQPRALKGLGIIWTRQGILLEAANILSSAKERLPQDEEVALFRARALYGLEFMDDSRRQLEEIMDRQPANGEALMLYAETSVTAEALDECEKRIDLAKAPDDKWVQLAGALVDLRRGSVDSGTSAVQRVLESNPDFARALALRATIFRVAKTPEKALEPMKKAADLAGPRSDESVAYGTLLMELGRNDDAIAWLKTATAKAPHHVPSWFTLARIALAAGNEADAEKYLAQAFRMAPMDIPSGFLQAQIWMKKKEPVKAMELLAKLSDTFPGRSVIELALAKACLAANNLDKAAALLDGLIARIPEAPEPLVLRARVHLGQNQPGQAAEKLEKVLKASPDYPDARDLLVSAYDLLGRVDEAVALLRIEMEKSGETGSAARYRLGQHLLAQGKTTEARDAFDAVLKLDPENLQIITYLISVDVKEGKSAAAMARVDEYITAHPQSNDALRIKAELYHRAGDLKNAEATALKALEIKEDDLLAYGIVVLALIQDGRSEEAVAQLRKLIASDPENNRARLHLGLLLQKLGRPDEARVAYEEVLKSSPDSATALNNLAYIESSDPARLSAARDYAAKARQLSPRDFSIADTLGWIEWKLGNQAAALPLLTEAASALPDLPSVQYHLGVVQSAIDRRQDAGASFERALASKADFPEKEDARTRLELLRNAGGSSTEDLEKRTTANPQDVQGHLELARRYAEVGKPDEALGSYQAALKASPSLTAAYVGIAKLYSGPLKSPEKAMEAATKARDLSPRDPAALAVLGSAKLQAGLPQEAYGMLKDATAQIKDEPALIADYARAAYLLGRVKEARDAIAPVAASDSPSSANGKRFLLFTGSEAGKQPQIAAEVEKSLAEDPTSIPALMVRAELDTADGKNAEATYQKILKLQPRFDPARVRLSKLYLDDPAKLEQAVSLAREARTNMPEDAELGGILGIASYRHRDFTYAAQVLEEVATRRPLAAEEFFALGMSQSAAGNTDLAAQNLNKSIQAGLDPARSAEAKAELEKIAAPKEK